ncbi:U3 snoRNP-associated protein Utp6 [Schizosaccharomyces cryophilus OY26]|uniref:U3 snoRNP-associated protein Utp6 n=1 Tax=Schizosaccharomyces cryophilus (strain OY26 / ATCC MYA-4695 / CBS 11777 / NBRC 106824 / NRRL Y48691) TaxID=653667 RepID=S9VY24_SCHCR|nr:U3 snoRNP-associated protein Utp6 [Schizosaccharomyces cryophilus OY26]EPY52513.1 U3 snoRNP-associated protein Utp6 [Schizosaccharomyces cryophilus OY26]
MAEKIQYYLERSIPELEDLLEKKIFNQEEINSIVKSRRDYEGKLARRQVKLTDFLSYIQYEMTLEALRKKRHKRLQIKGKTTVSDYAGMRKILYLFLRATNKFFGDATLWLDYIQYAKSVHATHIIGKICAAALQKHPNNIHLWLVACDNEFTENANMPAARSLMHRALRLNKENPILWASYFRLELAYMAKLHYRSEILLAAKSEEEGGASSAPAADSLDSDHIQLPSISMEEYLGDGNQQASGVNETVTSAMNAEDSTGSADQVEKYANVLFTIYSTATESLPKRESIEFLVAVLDLLFECATIPVARYLLSEKMIEILESSLDEYKSEGGVTYGALLHRWSVYSIFCKFNGIFPANASLLPSMGVFASSAPNPDLINQVVQDPEFVHDLELSIQKYQAVVSDLAISSSSRQEFYKLFIQTTYEISSLPATESSVTLALNMLTNSAFEKLKEQPYFKFDDYLQKLYEEIQIRNGALAETVA